MNTPTEGLPELLPCPFCGAPAKLDNRTEYEYVSTQEAISSGLGYSAGGISRTTHKVCCSREWNCYASVSGPSEAHAVAFWNTRAALAGEWRVPEGWRLVPVEATEAMKQAAYAQQAEFMRQLGEHCNGAPEPEDLFVLMWRAAISAAPLPKEPGHG